MYNIKHVTDDLVWVGGNDRRLALFEGVYPIPYGVSYNSYLLLDESTVLFDTVDSAIGGQFLENLAHALGGRKLNFIVLQHMEPDHASMLQDVMYRYPEAIPVCNSKTAGMVKQFTGLDITEKAYIVEEGGMLNTGRHAFTFVNAPMVHWPEVMVTYDTTDKILFSADAFGTFGAQDGALFSDEVNFEGDYLNQARIYYTNIVGKYGPQVTSVLKKASALEIKMICPLHGFVWRKNIGSILEKYILWSSYTPEEAGVVIAYGSIYGNTENAAEILASMLRQKGITTRLYDVSVTHPSEILAAAFRYSHVIFASPTYNNGIFTPMETLLHDIAAHNLQNRTFAFIQNGSWAPACGKQMRAILESLKNNAFLENGVCIKSSLCENQLEELRALAEAVAGSMPEKKAVQAPAVDSKVLNTISYGLYVLTAKDGDRQTGCIINTPCQVASAPLLVSISVNKQNHTRDVIAETGVFNLSVLSEDASFDTFKRFGFQSGRDTDKFAGFSAYELAKNGVAYVTEGVCTYLSGKVTQSYDLGSHTMFIAEVTGGGTISDTAPATYAYYHANIKPKKNDDKKKGFVCSICGYVYEGDTLPNDFVCPICKHGPEAFEPIG
jgi:flavorubredoxin/flavin reductase (DIM6/NTAB) family NADH-FMN oxidoreductase RutF